MDTLLTDPLPPQATAILHSLHASPRLMAHHIVVYDVARTLCNDVDQSWPRLSYDRHAVLLGAALHDVGKTLYPDELTGVGRRHENHGPALLKEQNLPDSYARFARTHAQWAFEKHPGLEDLLVALADTIWKGKRNERLENAIVQWLAQHCGEAPWQTFLKLDDMLQAIAQDAEIRLAWCMQFPA